MSGTQTGAQELTLARRVIRRIGYEFSQGMKRVALVYADAYARRREVGTKLVE